MKKILLSLLLLLLISSHLLNAKPIRVGVAGMTHDHINQVFDYIGKQQDVEIVGFAEPNKALAMRLLKRHNLPESMWFPTLEALSNKQILRLFVLLILFMSIWLW
jgi:predicted dehydrogenase